MADELLPTAVEASGIIRRIQADGDFATILKKGDADRGALLLVVTSRGRHCIVLERMPLLSGGYAWQATGPDDSAGPEKVREFLAKRTRSDPDIWLIELDIARAERFIAETTAPG